MASLKNLTSSCGTNYIPGTKATLYLVPKGELAAWPATEADGAGTDPGDTKLIAEAWDFTGAGSGLGYWRQVDILVNTGGVVETLEGEIGGQAMVQRLNFFVHGATETQKEFADDVAAYNGCLIAMISDKSGKYHVIGNLDDPCFIEQIEGGTGAAPGDRVGFAYTLYSNAGVTSLVYPSALGINTTPAV